MELKKAKADLKKANQKIVATKLKIKAWDELKNPLADEDGNYNNPSISKAIITLLQFNQELKKHSIMKSTLEKKINELQKH